MRTIVAADVEDLLRTLRVQYPGFRLLMKASSSKRCTTWNSTIYVQTYWPQLTPAAQYIRLTHEAQHLEQFARLGTWGFVLQYASFAGRFRLEQAPFQAEMRAIYDVFGQAVLQAKRAFYIAQFTGTAYWFCASEVAATAWVDAALAAAGQPGPPA